MIYYQGEEDSWKTEKYDRLMTAIIRWWREIFRNPELPFLFVQLPMWIQYDGEDTFTWARTRLAQAAVRDSVRNTGMICLLDEGEYGNIHPLNKRPVGERLAELAGKMLYGEGETVRKPLRTSKGRFPGNVSVPERKITSHLNIWKRTLTTE